MDILYLLVPLSAVLVLAIVAVFGWAVHAGQFDDLEQEGRRLLSQDAEQLDPDQGAANIAPQQFVTPPMKDADAPVRRRLTGSPEDPDGI